MKILYYIDSLQRGGAEMQALDVCRNGGRFGLEITAVSGAHGALTNDFANSGVEFIPLHRKFPVDLYLSSQLRRIIKEREVEIVHGYQPVDGVHLYLASRGLKSVKRVLSFQGFIQDKRNRLAARFLIPRMQANISVSQGLSSWLAEKDGLNIARNFSVLYNGADPARMIRTGTSIRGELGLKKNDLLIGMVANFYRDPRKDQLTVCRALPAVFRQIPDAHCLFAGGIETGAEDKMADCLNFCLDNDIADRVHFLGSRKDVPDILDELDVFVFSSLYEGLPVAVSEAMLAGVPMIVSEIDPLLEATNNGQFAETFPVGDHVALSKQLTELLGDKARREELSRTSREHALKNFSIDAHMKNLVSLYRSLMPQKS
ncbi:MAG TPA: glycosyltransferase [Pyrinomonadaceae bacterium]|nr:glycosyltransferase [Pyrinomonadaceae bacterium]